MPEDSAPLLDPTPPRHEILDAAYREELRFAQESLQQRQKRSPIYTSAACIVGGGAIIALLYLFLRHS